MGSANINTAGLGVSIAALLVASCHSRTPDRLKEGEMLPIQDARVAPDGAFKNDIEIFLEPPYGELRSVSFAHLFANMNWRSLCEEAWARLPSPTPEGTKYLDKVAGQSRVHAPEVRLVIDNGMGLFATRIGDRYEIHIGEAFMRLIARAAFVEYFGPHPLHGDTKYAPPSSEIALALAHMNIKRYFYASIQFGLSHEMAHIYLGHLNDRRSLAPEELEIEADLYAGIIAIQSYYKTLPVRPPAPNYLMPTRQSPPLVIATEALRMGGVTQFMNHAGPQFYNGDLDLTHEGYPSLRARQQAVASKLAHLVHELIQQ